MFDVSGLDPNLWWVPPLAGFLISAFTSPGGVSGAFLLLPFQMSILHFTSPSVSATNQLYNIVAIPGGVIRFIREGRMVWPLAWIVIIGTIPGVFIGALIRLNYMPDPTKFKIFAGLVLLYIGIRLIFDIFRKKKNQSESKFEDLIKSYRNDKDKGHKSLPKINVKKFSIKSLEYEFLGENFDVPTIQLLLISLVVGIAGGAYGIGGGAIIAPIYVALYKLPIFTIAGPALLGTFFTSIFGVAFYQFLAPYYPNYSVAPDWMLGILFGLGGLAGIYMGARLQKYIPAKTIKLVLSACIIFIGINYAIDIFKLF